MFAKISFFVYLEKQYSPIIFQSYETLGIKNKISSKKIFKYITMLSLYWKQLPKSARIIFEKKI